MTTAPRGGWALWGSLHQESQLINADIIHGRPPCSAPASPSPRWPPAPRTSWRWSCGPSRSYRKRLRDFKPSLSDREESHLLRAVPDGVRDLAPSASATAASATLVVPPLLLQQAALAQAPDEELAHVLLPHQAAPRGAPVPLAPVKERKSSNIWIA